jgi:hypothetical protein
MPSDVGVHGDEEQHGDGVLDRRKDANEAKQKPHNSKPSIDGLLDTGSRKPVPKGSVPVPHNLGVPMQ